MKAKATKMKSKPKSKAKTKLKTKTQTTKAKAKSKVASKPKPKLTSKGKPKLKVIAKPQSAKKAAAKATPAKASKSAAKPGSKSTNISGLFSPLDDRLIVEAIEAATRTAGGLYIPDTVEAGDRPQQGKVVAVGRGHKGKKGRIRPLDVQLGDTVLFETYLATPLNISEREYLIMRESQLLGVVKS